VRRRDFAESVALAALAPLLGLDPAGLRLEPLAGRPPLPDAAADPGALAKALAEAIRVQYGGRLETGDLATITKQIQASLERAEQVRKVDLANGDEPDFIYSAVPPRPAE
jgi:hypothetical protein